MITPELKHSKANHTVSSKSLNPAPAGSTHQIMEGKLCIHAQVWQAFVSVFSFTKMSFKLKIIILQFKKGIFKEKVEKS